ncbi:unnamed protein product, partial [Nesidiocoris tenuis]
MCLPTPDIVVRTNLKEPQNQAGAALSLLPLLVKGGLSQCQAVKVSALQSSEHFILRAQSLEVARQILQQRRNNIRPSRSGRQGLVRFAGRVQPLIVAIGGDGKGWTEITEYWVYIDRFLYSFPTLLEAVEICFRAIFVFNLHYSPECEAVWQVIQTKLFDLWLPSVSLYRSAEEFNELLSSTLENEVSDTEYFGWRQYQTPSRSKNRHFKKTPIHTFYCP